MTSYLLIIISYALIFLLSMFVFWQTMTTGKKHEGILYRNKRPLLPEHIFDFWVLTGIISILISRIFYIFSNFSTYINAGWSFTPWLRISENKVEWFPKYPWTFLNIIDGLDLGIFLLAFFLVFLLVIWIAGLDLKNVLASFKSAIFSMILMIEGFYLVTGIFGVGQDKGFNVNFENLFAENLYFFIILILTGIFILIDVFYFKNKRVEEDVRKLKLTFLIFSGYFSAMYLLIRLEQNYEYLFIYLALLPLIIGIMVYLYYERDALKVADGGVGQDQRPAAALKIDLLKKKFGKKARSS